KKDLGRYPLTLDMLIERPSELNRSGIGRWPYFNGNHIPRDPWGQKYRYSVPGKYNPESYDIWSVHGHSRNPDLWIGNWKTQSKDDI
ncbi:MAG: type II secretion system protein GspG, partial [Candidatus Aminicenantes bacterium]|nr:type II secretion system protein GspG [Candidatus Aminicenantes bacterium]